VDKSRLLDDSKAKHQISPRIGISFPITDKGIIHFSYGHFFQIPPFKYLYTNPDFKYEASGTPTFGNANLNPERTITYEIGLQQQLEDNLAFDVTCFVKDVRDLLALQQIRTSSSTAYNIYVNKDYANIKGFTASLTKRRNFDEFFGASLNYTYQVTEGSDTRSDAAFLDLASGRQSEKVPYYLAWDQPHNLNATLNFGYQNSWDITFVGRMGTGLPYTPNLIESQINLKTNSGRKPSQIQVDLLADKRFELLGFNLTVFLKIFNLFDNLIENEVYDDTGRATYTLEKERGTTALADRYASMNSLIKSSGEYFVRPDYYLAPREVRLGLSIDF
jgi:outer membrane receptor protein involved in Fe transport